MTKDEALRLALEALETSMYPQQKQLQAITAIKAALEAKDEPVAWEQFYPDIGKNQFAYLPPSPFSISGKPQSSQQEANEFNPDWDTQAVLTEEIQRMAKRIEELEAQGEPVARVCEGFSSDEKHAIDYWQGDVDDLPIGTQLYTTPPQRTWVGLTDEEIEQGCKESWVTEQAFQSAVWWAEAKLKERNT